MIMNEEQKTLVMQNVKKVIEDDQVQEVIVVGVNNEVGHFHVESTKQHYGFMHWVLNRLILEMSLSEKQAQEVTRQQAQESANKVVSAKSLNN